MACTGRGALTRIPPLTPLPPPPPTSITFKYLWARGVDYIAQLPGNEDPRKWYDRFPGLVEARDAEAEEKAPIEMMIAKDNWKWMPVGQASRLTERQDNAKVKDRRL